MFTHEGMWDEVKEDIGEETASLNITRLIFSKTVPIIQIIQTHGEGGHGIQGVAIDLSRYEGKDKIWDSVEIFVIRTASMQRKMVVRADIKCSQHYISGTCRYHS